MATTFIVQMAKKPPIKRDFLPEINQLLPEQKMVLKTPIKSDILVSGPAGSGKTILAVYRFLALGSQKGAILTYANVLLNYIATHLDAKNINYVAEVIFTYIKQLSEITVPARASTADFEEASNRAADWAKIHTGEIEFLIADECQDFFPGHIDFIARYAQHITLFADEAQSLYQWGMTTTSILGRLRTDHNRIVSRIEITGNNRNQPIVAQFANPFYKFRNNEPLPAQKQSGIEEIIEVYSCSSESMLEERAIKRIIRYVSSVEKETPKVGILTQNNQIMYALKSALSKAGYPVFESFNGSPISQLPGIEGNVYTSPHPILLTMNSCKGLEFDYIILYDLQFNRLMENCPDKYQQLLFTAITRARRSLSVFVRSSETAFFEKIKNVKYNLINL